MALTREAVQHIALLARLPLADADATRLAEQLDHILAHFRALEQVDTAGVEPTAHVVDLATPFRDDVVTTAPAAETWLANAPARDGHLFKVPKILE